MDTRYARFITSADLEQATTAADVRRLIGAIRGDPNHPFNRPDLPGHDLAHSDLLKLYEKEQALKESESNATSNSPTADASIDGQSVQWQDRIAEQEQRRDERENQSREWWTKQQRLRAEARAGRENASREWWIEQQRRTAEARAERENASREWWAEQQSRREETRKERLRRRQQRQDFADNRRAENVERFLAQDRPNKFLAGGYIANAEEDLHVEMPPTLKDSLRSAGEMADFVRSVARGPLSLFGWSIENYLDARARGEDLNSPNRRLVDALESKGFSGREVEVFLAADPADVGADFRFLQKLEEFYSPETARTVFEAGRVVRHHHRLLNGVLAD